MPEEGGKEVANAKEDGRLPMQDHNTRVIVFGQDVGLNGGVFRATEGLQERFGTERVVDTPLSEGASAGAAVGLAVAGARKSAVQTIDKLGQTCDCANQE